MKVVFDTNVLFAAVVARQVLCAAIVEAVVEHHDLAISDFILNELRDKLTGKTKLDAATVTAFVQFFRDEARQHVTPAAVDPATCRDPDDAAILGTALAATADVLVTGDHDLLVLTSFHQIPILSPRDFNDRFIASN